MKCHPFLYLCVLVTGITVTNLVYITRSSRKIANTKQIEPKRRLKELSITLLNEDEHTILSRIRYPDRSASVLFGHLVEPSNVVKRPKLVLGIATVARPPGVDYMSKTLHKVLDAIDAVEAKEVVIIVAMMDKERKARADRAKLLYRKFKASVDSGLVTIVGPPANIYPTHNYFLMRRRPFNNTVERMEWQSKLSLDFAYLFSFCSELGDFFMNLEDDIVPSQHFVRDAFTYVDDRQKAGEDWSSIQFSNYLSIGRFYRSPDLARLVELILISYTRQPVDFVMHHYDVLQMADNFKEYRRTPPLIEHTGVQSTIDVESIRARVTRKYESLKKTNPIAKITTNMTKWQDYGLDAAYRPGMGHFFWAKQFRAGDVIDVAFSVNHNIKAAYVVTGFDRDEEGAGHDRLVEGQMLVADDSNCLGWTPVGSSIDRAGRLISNDSHMNGVRCLRIKVIKGNSDWLVVRLIRILIYS